MDDAPFAGPYRIPRDGRFQVNGVEHEHMCASFPEVFGTPSEGSAVLVTRGADMNRDHHGFRWQDPLSVGRLCCVVVFVIAAIVLGGWVLRIPILTSLHPTLVSMKLNTALGLMALAAGILFCRSSYRSSVAGAAIGVAVALLGGLTLLEHVASVDLGIDQLLLPDVLTPVGTFAPGRMAPNTAINFVFLGLALLLRSVGPDRRGTMIVVHTLALTAILNAFLSLLGYFYGAHLLYGIARYTQIALHTTLGFIVLAVALLSTWPDRGFFGLLTSATVGSRLARWLVPAAIVVPVVLGRIRLWMEAVGLVDTALGLALFASANIVTFLVLGCVSANKLSHEDRARQRTAHELRQAHDQLEIRVVERTAELAASNRGLERAEALQRAILSSAMDAIITCDERGILIGWHGGAERTFGYRAEDVLQRPFGILLADRQRSACEDALRRARDTADPTVVGRPLELVGMKATGEEFSFEATLARAGAAAASTFTWILRDVTERQRAERELRETSALRRAILDGSAYSIIATLPDGTISELNAAAERLLGYGAGEVIGRMTPEVIHDAEEIAAQALVVSGELGITVEPGLEVLVARARRGLTDEREWTYVRKDGGRFPVRLSVTPIRDAAGILIGFVGIARDITEQRRTEAQLRQLADALENTLEGICQFDAQGRFLRVNAAYCATTGRSASSLLGHPWQQLVHPDDHARIAGSVREMVARGKAETERRVVRADGSTYLIRSTLVATHDRDGTFSGHFAFSRDVTAQRLAEQELVRARDAAETALRARADFLARMSHEIRTPMNGVLGMIDLAAQTRLTAEQRDYLTTARSSAVDLLSLIDDVLDFAKIDAQKLRLEAVPFALRDCVAQTLRSLAPRAHAKDLTLLQRIPAHVPDGVVGDPHRLRQVLINLVANAIKFTDRGEIVVELEAVARTPEHATIVIGVRDSGIGIPGDRLDAIFEAFVQADVSTSRRFGGTGLGLSICAQLVALMGGRIRVESELGRGSLFEISLPFALARELAVPVEVPSSCDLEVRVVDDHAIPGMRRSLEVLVAEDNAVNQKVATGLLKQLGHRVVVVEDGRQALAALACQRFDLVLMDVQMPVMDGLDATRALRASEGSEGRRLPVIAVTAQAMQGDRERCLASGMDAYVVKPLEAHVLAAAIAHVTAGSKVEAENAYDRGAFLARVAGDLELADEVTELLRKGAPAMLDILSGEVARADARGIEQAAHRLKGALSNLSAAPAVAAARWIEEQARRGDLGHLSEDVDALGHELQRLDAALARDSVRTT